MSFFQVLIYFIYACIHLPQYIVLLARLSQGGERERERERDRERERERESG